MADTTTTTTLANLQTTLNGLTDDGNRQVVEITDTGTLTANVTASTQIASGVLIKPSAGNEVDLENPTAAHVKLTASSGITLRNTSNPGVDLTIEGIEVEQTGTGSSNFPVYDGFADHNITIDRCILRGGYRMQLGRSGSTLTVTNSYVLDSVNYIANGLTGTVTIDHCALINGGANGVIRGTNLTLTNSYIDGAGTDLSGSGGSISYVATGDTSATGTGAVTSVPTTDVVDYANENFLAKDAGVLDGAGSSGSDIGPELVAINAIIVTSPETYHTLQRNGSNQANITITGTYSGSGTPTAIEASWDGAAYTTIDASPTGGSFSGSLANQNQGNGDLIVRWTNDVTATQTVENVGIGEVFLVSGQSNHSGRATNAQSYTGTANYCRKYSVSTTQWAAFNADPFDEDTLTGSYFPLLANHIVGQLGIPVAFIGVAEGSTTIDEWTKGHVSGLYTRLDTYYTGAASGGARCNLFYQGESDAIEGTTEANFKADRNSFANDINTDYGLDTFDINISGQDTAAYTDVRQWINDVAGTNANVIDGPDMWSVFQGIHYETNTETADVALAVWDALRTEYYVQTYEEALTLTANATVAQTGLLNMDSSTSMGASAGMNNSASLTMNSALSISAVSDMANSVLATFESGVSLDSIALIQQSPGNIYTSSASFGSSASMALSGGLALEAASSLAIQTAIAEGANITIEAGATFGASAQLLQSALVDWLDSVELSATVDLVEQLQADYEAGIALGADASINTTGGFAFESGLSIAASVGLTSSSEIGAEVVVTTPTNRTITIQANSRTLSIQSAKRTVTIQ